jgi:hypothetical protein
MLLNDLLFVPKNVLTSATCGFSGSVYENTRNYSDSCHEKSCNSSSSEKAMKQWFFFHS